MQTSEKNDTSEFAREDVLQLCLGIRELADGDSISVDTYVDRALAQVAAVLPGFHLRKAEWLQRCDDNPARADTSKTDFTVRADPFLCLKLSLVDDPTEGLAINPASRDRILTALASGIQILIERQEKRLREALSDPIALFTQRRQYENLLRVFAQGTGSSFAAIGSVETSGSVYFVSYHNNPPNHVNWTAVDCGWMTNCTANSIDDLARDLDASFEFEPVRIDSTVESVTFDTTLDHLLVCPIRAIDRICGVLLVGNRPHGYSLVDARIIQNISQCICPFLRADKERRTSVQQMEESLDTLETILDVSEQGAWIWDVRTGQTRFDRRWMGMLGYRHDEHRDHVSTWMNLCHPDDLVRAQERLERHWKNPETPYEIELRMRHKTGRWVWIWARGRVVERDAAGNPTRMVGTHLDITAMKGLQKELEEARDAAESASRAKDEFLTVISHEIRTPLNPIIGFSDLLMEEIDQPEQLDYLNAINDAGRHLNRLIGDILNYAKISRDTFDDEIHEANLADFINDTASQLAIGCRTNQFFLEWLRNPRGGRTIGPDLTVRAPLNAIHQILTHLTDNAFKFTDQGVVTLKVGIQPHEDERVTSEMVRFVVIVEDNGRGIHPEQVERLLKPFEVAQDVLNRDRDGIGLGLAITHKILEMLGGEIRIQSEPGVGSCFQIEIPLERMST